MNVFTKTAVKILPLTILLVCSIATEAKSSVKKDKRIDVKCFVELIGGGEKVTFWNIPSKKLSSLSNSIVGHKIMMANTKQKAEIYKTKECVLLKDNFTDSKAKSIDAQTAR